MTRGAGCWAVVGVAAMLAAPLVRPLVAGGGGQAAGPPLQGRFRQVDVTTKPGQPWTARPTRTLADVPELPADAGLDTFGGLRTRTGKATGFFHTEKAGNRWWLVTPEGGLFLHVGVNSIAPLRTPRAEAALRERFGSPARWAAGTTQLLQAHGFNGAGSWSDAQLLRAVERPLVQTRMWNFMSTYGRQRGGTRQEPGHTGYPNDCPFVFDPGFETFSDAHARQLAASKDDPWLLGHFSDNELPWKRTLLNGCLALPAEDPGRQAAVTWLRQRRGPAAGAVDVTETDQIDFLALAIDRYFRIVGAAIRRHDPNHLYLGARFHGQALRLPEVFRAAGPHLDVVSVNYYNAWTPDPERLAMWERESGRPVVVTEWYAKGMDSGMANTTGAGWLVRTQADRGWFYQNFVLALMESKVCVGWHWFKYADNDPADTKADPSNLDSNKGIVSADYAPWQDLLAAMKALNVRAYHLVDHFDGRR